MMHPHRIILARPLIAAAFGTAPAVLATPDDRFHGGALDGAATGFYNGYTPPSGGKLGRFVGGGYDGHAEGSASGLPNPLDGDSDSDGVPDWWEASNYLSLTLTAATTDIDGDRRGSLSEYLADTDPNDPLARLGIAAISLRASILIEYAITSADRRNWVEASSDLTSAEWSPATEPSIAENGGSLEFTLADEDEEARKFFHIRVALP
jgi:hypothetical protein